MPLKGYPTDIMDQATDTLEAWKQIDPNLRVGPLTQQVLADGLAQSRAVQAQIAALEKQLVSLRNTRDGQMAQMWDAVKRLRATVKGVYGDDSSQYELVGGTRTSERKRASRRAAG